MAGFGSADWQCTNCLSSYDFGLCEYYRVNAMEAVDRSITR